MQQHSHDPTSTSAGGRLGAGEDGTDPIQTPSDAFRDAANQVAQLKDYVAYYLAAKKDGLITSVRNAGIYAALGLVGLVALLTVVVMASALFVLAIAHAFARLFNGHEGIAYLVTAVLIFAALGAGAYFGMSMLTKASRKRTVDKYEQWKNQQRAKFGTDVERQARDADR
jgi:Zn-dependent protease with chaperone function